MPRWICIEADIQMRFSLFNLCARLNSHHLLRLCGRKFREEGIRTAGSLARTCRRPQIAGKSVRISLFSQNSSASSKGACVVVSSALAVQFPCRIRQLARRASLWVPEGRLNGALQSAYVDNGGMGACSTWACIPAMLLFSMPIPITTGHWGDSSFDPRR